VSDDEPQGHEDSVIDPLQQLPRQRRRELRRQRGFLLEQSADVDRRQITLAGANQDARRRGEGLDFGLAKTVITATPAGSLADSPTLTALGTELGVILGTAVYMAPEQARGKVVDRRVDIWASGACTSGISTTARSSRCLAARTPASPPCRQTVRRLRS